MKVETTSITFTGVNICHNDLRKLLLQVIYPDYLHGFETLSVMIVCVRGETHQHDAYVHQGKPYISIALDYDTVTGLSYEVITVLCKQKLRAYLDTLSGLPERKVV
ncbi:MAG: hypothetical protein KDD01_12315 [Phaeodactylibacter sp.]|nr:hypothetical protein [Phaeodactylibacter sp.]